MSTWLCVCPIPPQPRLSCQCVCQTVVACPPPPPCGWIAHQFRLVHIITSDCYCGTVSATAAPSCLCMSQALHGPKDSLTLFRPGSNLLMRSHPPISTVTTSQVWTLFRKLNSLSLLFVSLLGGGICVSGEICLELSCTQNTRLITFHLHNIG